MLKTHGNFQQSKTYVNGQENPKDFFLFSDNLFLEIPKIFSYHWFSHPLCITIFAELNELKAIEMKLTFVWAVVADLITILTRSRGNKRIYGRSIDLHWQLTDSLWVAELTIHELVDVFVLALKLDVDELT